MKKISALLSAMLIMCAFSLSVSASSTREITGVSKYLGQGGIYMDGRRNAALADVSYLEHLDIIHPGTQIFIALNSRDFEWIEEKETMAIDSRTVNLFQISVTSDAALDKANGVFEKIVLTEQDGMTGILIRFVDNYPATEPLEFSAVVHLNIFGNESDNGTFKVSGALRNRKIFAYPYNKSVRLGTGRVAQAGAEIENMPFDLGNGVSVRSSLTFQKLAYGDASTNLTANDKSVIARYPSITKVYHLRVVNLNGPVSFTDDKVYYVYDNEMRYLGLSNKALALRQTYYFSTAPLA